MYCSFKMCNKWRMYQITTWCTAFLWVDMPKHFIPFNFKLNHFHYYHSIPVWKIVRFMPQIYKKWSLFLQQTHGHGHRHKHSGVLYYCSRSLLDILSGWHSVWCSFTQAHIPQFLCSGLNTAAKMSDSFWANYWTQRVSTVLQFKQLWTELFPMLT